MAGIIENIIMKNARTITSARFTHHTYIMHVPSGAYILLTYSYTVFVSSTVRCVPLATSHWAQQCLVQCALQAVAVHRPVTRPSHVTMACTAVRGPPIVHGVLLDTSVLPPVVSSI